MLHMIYDVWNIWFLTIGGQGILEWHLCFFADDVALFASGDLYLYQLKTWFSLGKKKPDSRETRVRV